MRLQKLPSPSRPMLFPSLSRLKPDRRPYQPVRHRLANTAMSLAQLICVSPVLACHEFKAGQGDRPRPGASPAPPIRHDWSLPRRRSSVLGQIIIDPGIRMGIQVRRLRSVNPTGSFQCFQRSQECAQNRARQLFPLTGRLLNS